MYSLSKYLVLDPWWYWYFKVGISLLVKFAGFKKHFRRSEIFQKEFYRVAAKFYSSNALVSWNSWDLSRWQIKVCLPITMRWRGTFVEQLYRGTEQSLYPTGTRNEFYELANPASFLLAWRVHWTSCFQIQLFQKRSQSFLQLWSASSQTENCSSSREEKFFKQLLSSRTMTDLIRSKQEYFVGKSFPKKFPTNECTR